MIKLDHQGKLAQNVNLGKIRTGKCVKIISSSQVQKLFKPSSQALEGFYPRKWHSMLAKVVAHNYPRKEFWSSQGILDKWNSQGILEKWSSQQKMYPRKGLVILARTNNTKTILATKIKIPSSQGTKTHPSSQIFLKQIYPHKNSENFHPLKNTKQKPSSQFS